MVEWQCRTWASPSGPERRTVSTYHMWERRCPDDPYPRLFEIAETDPVDLLPGLIDRLRSRELPIPEPVFAALDPTHGWAYVTVPVDFRAGGDSWRTVSVTARLRADLGDGHRAVPSNCSFDPGDPAGGGASCDGEAPVAGYVASTPGECSYTYMNSSSTSPVRRLPLHDIDVDRLDHLVDLVDGSRWPTRRMVDHRLGATGGRRGARRRHVHWVTFEQGGC